MQKILGTPQKKKIAELQKRIPKTLVEKQWFRLMCAERDHLKIV
jgi:predicted oxidoreductase